jgi:hypothetical protein
MTEEELLGLRNFGQKSLVELQEKLVERGIIAEGPRASAAGLEDGEDEEEEEEDIDFDFAPEPDREPEQRRERRPRASRGRGDATDNED